MWAKMTAALDDLHPAPTAKGLRALRRRTGAAARRSARPSVTPSFLSAIGGVPVRVIEARISTACSDGTDSAGSYRLVTTLLDARRYPATVSCASTTSAGNTRAPTTHCATRPRRTRLALGRPGRRRAGDVGPPGPLPASVPGHWSRRRSPGRAPIHYPASRELHPRVHPGLAADHRTAGRHLTAAPDSDDQEGTAGPIRGNPASWQRHATARPERRGDVMGSPSSRSATARH